MANETQFRATTRIIATRGVKEYRETIPAVVGPDDHVLEVGCEWGTTTAVLAQYAAHVIGTDISPSASDVRAPCGQDSISGSSMPST